MSPPRLLLLTAVAGMAAVVALPLAVSAPRLGIPLALALPLLVALVARRRASPTALAAAFVLLILIGLGIVFPVAGLAHVVVAAIPVGAVVAVVVVGAELRGVDTVAAAGFLLAAAIAVIAGLGTARTAGSAALTLGVGLVGLTVVTYRLGRR